MNARPINILLADDDKDDRFFFAEALKELSIKTYLTVVNDGEKLITYLLKHSDNLPDVLFLDLNMPRKNGLECLIEIKNNEKLKKFPVIIYSTSLNNDISDILYKNGAYYYVRKTDLDELKNMLLNILTLIKENNFIRPLKDKFIIEKYSKV